MGDHGLEAPRRAALTGLDVVVGGPVGADHQELGGSSIDDHRADGHLVPAGLIAHGDLGHHLFAAGRAVREVDTEQSEAVRIEDLAGVRSCRVDRTGDDAGEDATRGHDPEPLVRGDIAHQDGAGGRSDEESGLLGAEGLAARSSRWNGAVSRESIGSTPGGLKDQSDTTGLKPRPDRPIEHRWPPRTSVECGRSWRCWGSAPWSPRADNPAARRAWNRPAEPRVTPSGPPPRSR